MFNSSSGQRFDRWLADVNRICGAFAADPAASHFEGQIAETRRGAIKFSQVQAQHARIFRTRQEIKANATDYFYGVFQMAGSAVVSQDDQCARLKTGELVLVDASRPCVVHYGEQSEQLSLILPRELVERGTRYARLQCGRSLSGALPGVALARQLLEHTLAQQALSQVESEASLEAIVSLLRPVLGEAAPQEDPHDRAWRRVMAYIDEHLRDTELSPERLARDIGLSVRGLYRLFARHDLVVAQYIRNRRLDLCAEALRQTDPSQKLSALGYAWGFADASHFTTAFKGRFGVTPGAYRQQFAG